MDRRRALLASRYELTATLESTHHAPSWVGLEISTGTLVRVATVDARELDRYRKLGGVRQLHLAGVQEVLGEVDFRELGIQSGPGRAHSLVVFEYVGGVTLHKHLLTRGRLEPFKAVAWVLRLIAALEAMHAVGVPHGSLSPRSVIAEPAGRVIPPILMLASAPVLAAYCSPERVRGAAPSVGDDVWALLSTMYRMVTGEAPFSDTDPRVLLAELSRCRPRPLQEFEIDDLELQRVFDAAFEPNERQRLSRLDDLKKALDRWEREESPVLVSRASPSRALPRLGTLTLGGISGPNAELVYGDRARPADEGGVPAIDASLAAGRSSLVGTPTAAAESSSVSGNRSTSVGEPRAAVRSELGPSPERGRLDSLATQLSARRMRRGRVSWLLLGVPVLLAAVGIGYLEFGDELGIGAKTPTKPTPDQVESASRSLSRTSSVKATGGRNGGNRAQRRASCVESYFPKGVFDAGADFEFLCEGGDFRATTTRLFGMAHVGQAGQSDAGASAPPKADARADGMSDGGVLIVKSSINPAQRELDLGWYELVAATMTRAGCCEKAPSIDVPETKGWCVQLEKALRQVADDSRKPGDLSPTIRGFDEAVECLFANQIPRPYVYELRPTVQQRAMLQRFLTRAAENEAKRASGR